VLLGSGRGERRRDVSGSALSESERALVAETWTFRAHAERSASLRFERLARELRQAGAPSVVIDLAETAVTDEIRHAGLCDSLAQAYSHEGSVHECDPAAPAPLGPPGLGEHDRLLFEVVAFCCFTETLNTAMLVETLKGVREPQIRAAVQEILRDEVQHSRLGWAHLAAMRAQDRGDFLSETLPYMFETADVAAIFTEDLRREDPRLAFYGELCQAQRVGIFHAAMRDVVFPGLEAQGVRTEAGRAWLQRQGIELTAPTDPALHPQGV
jgi:hypothetical protein